MKTSFGKGKLIAAIAVGTIFGVALKFLFSPSKCCHNHDKDESGVKDIKKDLRKKMKEEADILRSKADDLEGVVE